MPPDGSPYPWRCANDADFDITGQRLAQGAYRSVVWGDSRTYLYTYPPETFGKAELISPWGFPAVRSCWHYPGDEGKPIELLVFSAAEEVELLVNGRSAGRKPVDRNRPLPGSVRFETVYEPGRAEAVSYTGGKEISRAVLSSSGQPSAIRLTPEKTAVKADGHDLVYVNIEITDRDGNRVPDAEIPLKAAVAGPAVLAGFGTGRPVTEENYTDGETASYRGRATLILRAGYEKGTAEVTVSGEGMEDRKITISVG